jgi:hypothetical protein
MKLYKVPRNSKIRILYEEDTIGPPGSITLNLQDTYHFGHIDGMYSYCKTHDGIIAHIPAWAEVEIVSEDC